MAKAKIITRKGKHLTIDVSWEDEEQLSGTDKYGEQVTLMKKNIAERIPYA